MRDRVYTFVMKIPTDFEFCVFIVFDCDDVIASNVLRFDSTKYYTIWRKVISFLRKSNVAQYLYAITINQRANLCGALLFSIKFLG